MCKHIDLTFFVCLFKLKLTGSLSPGDQGLANIADVEHGWCLDIIPVLL